MTDSSILACLRGYNTAKTKRPDAAVTTVARRTSVVVMAMLVVSSMFVGTVAFAGTAAAAEDDVGFGVSALSGAELTNPTALQFGPDGRLYVSQQNGMIYAYEIERTGENDYEVTATEEIGAILDIPNHNDDGSLAPDVDDRQVTGMVVAGTATNPVLFVSSSDPRIGGGGSSEDTGLDTNSGTVSKLTQTGSGWEHVVLVRGLPRSEENHAPNGMAYDAASNTLYLSVGGHTNMGAPSNNFVYLPEYAYSAAILEIDLDEIEGMEPKTDGEVPYKYDLPTLQGGEDPFGGQGGVNMAYVTSNSPVQIYSPGYRNAYDIVLTEDGQLYTVDNGANSGWGDVPVGEGTETCTNEPNEPGDSTVDNLHLVTEGFYGGHPNPTRANPAGTGIYDEDGNLVYEFGENGDPLPVPEADPRQCNFIPPTEEESALATFGSSTNGITEYTASNFGGVMQGDLLTASFDGTIYRVQLNDAGDEATEVMAQFSNFGSIPLDVTAQGDSEKFPGTVWAATYGSDDITVFEPNDYGDSGSSDPPQCDVSDPNADADGDGYTNGDEQAVGTDPCSAASAPADYDEDGNPNELDPNDDNDGLDDTEDPFAVDPENGLSTTLPVTYNFSVGSQPDSLEGIGFTGLMSNGEDYQSLYDPENVISGGAAPVLTVEDVQNGDAYETTNTQKHAFQFGIGPPDEPFTVNTTVSGLPENPEDFQSLGIFIGEGDQDNYVKLVVSANGGNGGIEFATEVDGKFDGSMTPDSSVVGPDTETELFLTVYPNTNTVEASYAVDGGEKVTVGETQIPASWLDTSDGAGLAVGVIATSFGPAGTFAATWEGISVTQAGNEEPVPEPAGGTTEITILEGSDNIDGSTYNSGAFEIENTGNEAIESVTFDLSSSALPDMVFDPVGTAGDTVGKDFTPDSGADQTGLVSGEFSQPHEGNPDDGYDVLTIEFDDFDPGETFAFSVDNDPTSIEGAPGSHPAGPVSGLELVRSTVTVEYVDGSTQTTNVFSDGSAGGAQATVKADPAAAPTIDVVGVEEQGTTFSSEHTAATVTDAEQMVEVSGPPGATVQLLQVEAELALGEGAGDGYEIEAYEANKALVVGTYPVTIGADGTATVPVTLTESTENGGLNYFVAAVVDEAGDTGRTSNVIVLEYEPNPTGNQAPMLNPISDQSVSVEMTLDVPVNATDPEGDPITLSASGLPDFATFTDDGDGTGNLTLSPESGDAGTYQMTITASDGELEDAETVNVTVTRPAGEVVFAVNAGGGQYTASDGTVYQADTNFEGGATFATDDPISGTVDDPLYQTERYQTMGEPLSYAIPVENGTYNVTLKFAEIFFDASNGGAGERVFDVSAEGAQVVTNLDIYERVGHDTALDITRTVTVTDGELNLGFNASVNNAKISAILVEPAGDADNQPPVAAFSYSPTNPTVGESVAFTDESTDSDGSIASWSWEFGDGTTSAMQNPTHTYTESGTYTVTLTVTDDSGASDTVTKTVTVSEAPPTNQPPTADAGNDQTVNEDETVELSGMDSTDPDGDTLTYQWTQTSGPDVDLQGANTATPTFTAPAVDTETTLTFELTVSDGSASDTDTVTVVVQPVAENAPPSASFTYSPQEPETGEEVVFDASGTSDSDGDIASYMWDFDSDGTVDATGQQVTHTYTEGGTYTATLTVTDDDGASDTVTKTVTVTTPSQQPDENTLRIEGSGEYAFYAFSATSDVNGESITREDNVEGSTVSGAVGPGTDSFSFEGELETLYVGESANVFLNGEEIDPDSYESIVTIDGDGSFTSYQFDVTREITDSQGLDREDNIDEERNSASGAVAGSSESYTFTGIFTDFDVDGDAAIILNGQPVDVSMFDTSDENTLRIEGSGEYAFYAFSATSDVSGESTTSEDTIEGSTVSGAVGPGTDSFSFEGELETLYVQDGTRVFLNGEEIDPDSYESIVTIDGDGSYSSYNFAVTGDITDSQSLTREDNVDESSSSASGAVRAGSESYTFTGVFQGFDVDGDATVILNGQPVSVELFYNRITFEGTGSFASYDFTVSGEVIDGESLTQEDSIDDNMASGAIRNGQDSFVYSGTLEDLTTDGNVVIIRNGEVITEDEA